MSSRVASTASTARSKSTPSIPPQAVVAPDTPDEAEVDVDIESVSASLGAATEDEAQTLLGGVSDAALITEGARVATPRISKEAARVAVFANGFFATATPAARSALCMSPDVVRIMAWTAAQGNRAWRRLSAMRAQRKTTKTVRSDAHDALATQARGARDQIADALRKVARGSDEIEARIEAAMTPAAQGEADVGPGKSLASLVVIAREQLASAKKDVRTRCEMWGVTAARIDEAEKLAAKAQKAERAANAPGVDLDHEQSVVDRWDGINLILIDQIVRAFAKARAAGKAVKPFKLVHLRGILGARKAKRAVAAKPVTPPGPPSDPR